MTTAFVVPCFNEESRFNCAYWDLVVQDPQCQWLFVDDGSSDDTMKVISSIVGPNVSHLRLDQNVGKGEVVRLGLSELTSKGHSWVGFVDADASVPKSEIVRLTSLLDTCPPERIAVWGSRVQLSGRRICRRTLRHFAGRIVSTVLSAGRERFPYDSQCGLKLFRNDQALRVALAEEFLTRWLFDVELFDRFVHLNSLSQGWLWEEPLMDWVEVGDSRISGREVIRVTAEMVRIFRQGVTQHRGR